MVDYVLIFHGRFETSPYDIQKSLHEFSKKFIDDEDYLIVPRLDETTIIVNGFVNQALREFETRFMRFALHFGYLDFLSPLKENTIPVEIMIFSSPGNENYWNDFILDLQAKFLYLDPGLFPEETVKPAQQAELQEQSEHEVLEKHSKPQLPSQRIKLKPKGVEAIDRILSDRKKMRELYPDYSPKTAKAIVDAIPKARIDFHKNGGHWGPNKIAKIIKITPSTISRYLGAIKKAGIEEIPGDGEMIPIPHTSKSTS